MRKSLALILTMLSVACLAQEQTVPTRHIVSEDVIQDSVRLVGFSTNRFSVLWTYTEAGAQKALAFREAHEGKTVQLVIGAFKVQSGEMIFRPMPPVFTNYAQWKEGWLKSRTDKVFGVSEDDAKKIVEGLKKK